MSEYKHLILHQSHPLVIHLYRIAQKISNSAVSMGLKQDRKSLNVYVISSSISNAFVLSNGDIFVFSGILPVAQDDEGIATILSHEVKKYFD